MHGLVGPGDLGKTPHIYSMPASSSTFYPLIEITFYNYKENQTLFQEMSGTLTIEFIPCLDFEMIKNLENCLLVFDDSPVDTENSIAFSSNTTCSIKATGRVRLILTQHMLFYSNHHETYSKLIISVDNWNNWIFFEKPVRGPPRGHSSVTYWFRYEYK